MKFSFLHLTTLVVVFFHLAFLLPYFFVKPNKVEEKKPIVVRTIQQKSVPAKAVAKTVSAPQTVKKNGFF